MIGNKRRHVLGLLRAAIERGELPANADIELIAESGPALVWHHALYGLPITSDLPDRIIALVLAPRTSAPHAAKR